tara:strand:- start:7890 stop:9101 length:1212 start_codon:yes stop_codon:yes gene_type:complete
MSWKLVSLNDVTSKIGDGLHGTPKYDEKGQYYFVNGNNFNNGKIEIKPLTKKINEDQYQKIKKNINDETLFVSINGTLGNVALYRGEKIALGKSACYLNVDKNVSRLFIKYVLEGDSFQGYAHTFATGSTIKNLGLKAVRDYKFNLPELNTQKKIASILSTYDDLIDNNLKRIQLLEEAAQRIYKEWFVDFKFPDHENTPINPETGLPEGWERKEIQEIAETIGGGTPSTKNPEYWESGNIRWFSPTDLSKNSSLVLLDSAKKINEFGLKKSSAKLLPPKTILMSSRATIGLFGLIDSECSTNQGFINIIPRGEEYRYYILFNLMSRKSELEAYASGATFKELSKTNFRKMEIINPSENIANSFNSIVEEFFKSLKNLAQQNQNLKEARDLLLPRMMNRAIEV